MLKLIEDWKNKDLKCHYCGTTKDVKYEVSLSSAVIHTCGECILKFIKTLR